jgi:hypothetical protein
MSERRFRRRHFLQSAGVASVGAVAGCLEAENNGDDEDDPEPASTSEEGEEGAAEPDDDGRTDDPRRTEMNGVAVHRKKYDLVELSFEEWPQYGEDRRLPPYCEYPNAAAVDEEIPDLRTNTVTLFDVENDEGHHPLRTSRTIMRLIHCYRETDDERYLEKAESISEAMLDIATERDGALYVPYGYDWGAPEGSRFMEAPWYGGMAQGTVLTAYAHLYEATGDEAYREVADGVFASFTNVQQVASDVWTTIVSPPTEMPGDADEPAYFWIEEYPVEPPQHVLNGFGVGLFGLYDYWLLVDREAGYDPLCAAITTIEDHVEEYRVPGDVSWYDLAEVYGGNEHYHSTHINQLRLLANLSNEGFFAEMADLFDEDHPYEEYRPERPD